MKKDIYLSGVDFFRVIAAFAVVLIHFFPIEGNLKGLVVQGCRFAVPFFFCASGYFLSIKLMNKSKKVQRQIILKYLTKTLSIYLFWTSIYVLYRICIGGIDEFSLMKVLIIDLFFKGVYFHLWFFPSLLFSVVIFYLFIGNNYGIAIFFYLSIILYGFGLIAKAYSNLILGFEFGFDTRYFVFFSLLPFASGVVIQALQLEFKMKYLLGLFILLFLLQYLEIYFIKFSLNGSGVQDYVISTALLGVTLFLIAVKLKVGATLASLGKFSLGIYIVHPMLIPVFVKCPIAYLADLWFLIGPFLVFVSSMYVTILLRKVKYLNNFL